MSALVPSPSRRLLLGAGVALIFGGHRKVQVGVSIVTLTLVMVIAAVSASTPSNRRAKRSPCRWAGGRSRSASCLRRPTASRRQVVISAIVPVAVLLFSVGQGAADGDDDTLLTIFHPTYLILAAGIFNAFIAGDLFNLYVGFEILLVASYVLITLSARPSRASAPVSSTSSSRSCRRSSSSPRSPRSTARSAR